VDVISAAVTAAAYVGRGLLLAALFTAGCGRPLANAQPSPDALADQVLTALQQRDVDRLRQLALTESEFRDVVWPELPAARPERNLPFDYVWNDLWMKSEASLRRLLAEHGGQALSLERLDFAGETTQHHSYLVRREAVVVARHAGQPPQSLRLFGSMIERDGGFKVFSYVVD
jgi:hypothetical protein